MDPFLQRLAHALLDRHGEDLARICVVLPGKRAGLYLRKYLAEQCQRTIWSPRALDVGGFLTELAGMRQGGSMELLFLLYEAHVQVQGASAESLDDVLMWAPTTMRDMSEVDAHALDLDNVYRDLRSYHEIEEWSFRLGEESPGQARSNQHWRHTGTLHQAFAQLMRERGVGTSGAVARTAMERVLSGTAVVPYDAVWFAGLNALEPATTRLIKALQAKGIAHVAWDTDTHYLEDKAQEAGQYLRRSMADLGPGVLPPGDGIRTRTRTFRESMVPNAMAQATLAGNLLADLDAEQRSRTAIVLADEGLLMPLLAALPADTGPLNITMGLPLEALPIHGCTEAFLALHAGYRRSGEFRLADLERLLLHPFLHQPIATARAISRLRGTRRSNMAYEPILEHTEKAGMELCSAAHEALRPVAEVGVEMPGRMAALLTWAQRLSGNDRYRMEQVFQMARMQRSLDQGLERMGSHILDLDTYSALRMRLLREERIAFFGEPLRGTQIMGVLETRALDHERIIILGLSEGTFPRGGQQQSWIPYDVRRVHGLPLASDADAIAAYHFQRMAQQCSHLDVLHSAGDGPGSGGPSRFILQWDRELKGSSATHFVKRTLTSPFPVRPAARLQVHKDEKVVQRLTEICAAGLSPSALAMWLRCPLDFYFTRVLGIRTADEVDGRLGSDVLGDAVHAVLEEVITPMLGTAMDPELLLASASQVQALLTRKLGETFPADLLQRGNFRLRVEMASQALVRHLKAEATRCAATRSIPIAVELDLDVELRPGVRIRGRCDRIEERDGVLHILDLKTGAVEAKQLRIPELDRAHFDAKRAQALQLLVYGWAYLKSHPTVPFVRAGILPIQKASEATGLMLHVGTSMDLQRSDIPAMEELLSAIVDEVLNPDKALEHDPDSAYCKACLTA
jgi:ATP-dependent helicase/nuclease subunit B